jgi:F-type H+-transporting ATPase subunit b
MAAAPAMMPAAHAAAAAGSAPSAEAAHEAHGGEHPHIGEANPGPKLEDPSEFKSSLALWSFVVFVLLLAVLWKFAWGPICQGLDQRERRIAENIAAAERSGEEARKIMAQYEAKLAGAADEVRQLLEEARRDAEHTKAQILAEAKVAAQTEHDRQMREIQTATDAALKTLAEKSAHWAVELAGKFIRRQLSPHDHERLIREAVENFPLGQPSRN